MINRIEECGDILSVKDVHDILGIGYNKTYWLLKSGEIKSFKIGREIKIPKKCLIDYIEKQTTSSN